MTVFVGAFRSESIKVRECVISRLRGRSRVEWVKMTWCLAVKTLPAVDRCLALHSLAATSIIGAAFALEKVMLVSPPWRALVTSAGRKHAMQVPAGWRTLG